MKWRITLLLLLISLFGYTQEINVRLVATSTNYLTTSTFNTFPATVSGVTSAATIFTIQNLGGATLNLTNIPLVEISGTDASSFIITQPLTSSVAAAGTTTFTIAFSPTSVGTKTAMLTIESDDADESSYTINLSATATASALSNIIITPIATPYVYPQNIAYQNYQANDITNSVNDIEVGRFIIQDVADADNLPTTLTDVTFSLPLWANIRSVALYDGATEVGADEDSALTVTFNGLNLTAPDNGTKTFTIRVSYNDVVTDGAIPQFIITAATALSTGSGFTYTYAGTTNNATSSARTNNTTPNNRIEVTATKLDFIQGPTDTDTFVAMSPAVTVQAVDNLDNLDTGYTTAIILTTTGSFDPVGPPPNDANNPAVLGLAAFPIIKHQVAGTGFFLTANSGSLAPVVSNAFDIGSASGASNYFRSRASGDWNVASNWETSHNNVDSWITSTLVPNNVSREIRILSGHTITCTTTANGDQMIVDAGGTFALDTGANFTLHNGSTAYDLTVRGTVTYNNGTLNKIGVMAFGATGVYNHAIVSPTLTLPIAVWNATSICNVTGLNNATPIGGINMNQNFGIFNWNNPNQIGYVAVNHGSFKVTTTLNIGTATANANNALCLADSGTFTNAIKTININGGKLIAAAGTGSNTMTITGTTTIAGGELIGSQGSGTATINTNTTFNISSGKFILIDNANSGNVNFTLSATNRDFTVSGTGALLLENVSSTTGTAALTLNRSFISSSTATPAVDFGTGTVTNNAINIKSNLTKTDVGTFTTTSINPAKGFVFNGTTQALSYAGANSSSVNYTVNSGSQLTMSTSLTFGTSPGPESVFTVKTGGRINLGATIITGNPTLAQFIAETGSTISSSSTGGLGGTGVLGNFQSFGSVDLTPATGRLALPAGIHYILAGVTTTPFPVGAGIVFGNPATLTTSVNITSNMKTALTITSAFNITANTFKLNTTNNNLILNNAVLTITGNFDNNGENQILNGGGSPSIIVNGKFLTRDVEGFVGNNTAIPTIVPTLGAASSVEYALAGNQAVQGSPAYKNLIFSGSGTKTLDSNTTVATKITVTSPAIFDAQSFTAGGTGTTLTMTGTAQYKTSGTGVKPDATGAYSLAAGAVIEFYGTQPIEIRLGSPAISYGKIVVNGTDVFTNSTTTGIQFVSTGAGFTVKNGAVFKFKNTDGFTGSTSTALINTPLITPVLDAGSTIEYAGASQFITPLALTAAATNSYKKMIISGTGTKTIPGAGEIFIADNLTVTSSKLEVGSNRLFTVNNGIVNSGGEIEIQNTGNLVQINNIANTGNIKMIRDTRVMKPFDYVYLGSPVLENMIPQLPSVFTAKYMWNLTGAIDGSWAYASSNVPGRGFITRKNGTAAATHSIEFTGTPNNGSISVSADCYDAVTTTASGNHILLANPYPSAVDATKLIFGNSTIMAGTLYFWTALTAVAGNQYSSNDYASWNYTGGVATAALSDPAQTLKPTGFIAAGQGFFARIKLDGTINFTNSMRPRTTTNNSQFFKPAPTEVDENVVDHKIWLNLTNTSNAFRQMLVGYIAGATNEIEDMFDGESFTNNEIDLYSIVEDKKLVIQGRAYPFVNSDLVPLGYKITTAGNYTIAIDELKGVFEEDQDVYLEDLLLNTTHDLKASVYNFATEAGVFENRFVLKYVNTTLGNDDFDTISNSVMVLKNKAQLHIKSSLEDMTAITVYDILGRQVFDKNDISQNEFKIDGVVMNTQTIIVKVKLQNGMVVTKKVIY